MEEKNVNFGGDFKLAIKADEYLKNPNSTTLNAFKEELKISSSISIATVLEKLLKETKSNEYCKQLVDLILPKFEPNEPKEGVYDPMLGEIIYADDVNKKKM